MIELPPSRKYALICTRDKPVKASIKNLLLNCTVITEYFYFNIGNQFKSNKSHNYFQS